MIQQTREALALLGRSRFSGPGVFTVCLLYQLVLHFEDDTVNLEVPIWQRLAIVLVVHIVCYSLIKFGREYLLPVDRGGFQLVKALVVLVLVAILRGALLYSMTNTFQLYTIDSLYFRVANSLQVMTVVYGIIGLADQAFKEWRARKNELVRDNSKLEAMLRVETEKSSADHQRLIDTVSGQLLRFVRDVERSSSANVVENLRNGIANIVRPLTREIDELEYEVPRDNPQTARVNWKQVILGLGQIRPIEPAVIPSLLLLAAAPYIQLHFGLSNAVKVAIVVFVIGVTTLGVFDLATSRFRLGWFPNILVMVTASLTTALLAVLTVTAMLPGQVQPIKLMIILGTFINAICFMVAMNKSLFNQIRLVEQELISTHEQLSWALARQTEVQRQRSRALALALHGPVQTAVGAAIIRLENATKNGSISDGLIAEVSDLVYSSLEQLQKASSEAPLAQVFSELRDTWEGICDIQTKHSKAVLTKVEADQVTSALIAECIPELCFNAIKHGDATQVSVTIGRPGSNSVDIVIEDNGKKYQAGSKQGLGLKHLSESALSVAREYINQRNTTIVTLPYQA